MTRYLPPSLLLLSTAFSAPVWAQTDTEAVLPTVEVSAPRLAREIYATPAAVSTIEQDAIAQGQQRVRLDESLNRVPGVFLQNRDNFAQGQRISIRGFGARAPFGVRGITVMVDGIPYTLPDGQAQLDAIDLDSAERIEVIRGPSSVLYGNAAGGVIDITTADGRDNPGTPPRSICSMPSCAVSWAAIGHSLPSSTCWTTRVRKTPARSTPARWPKGATKPHRTRWRWMLVKPSISS